MSRAIVESEEFEGQPLMRKPMDCSSWVCSKRINYNKRVWYRYSLLFTRYRKKPKFKDCCRWKLQYNNAPAHLAHVVLQFLVKYDILVVLQSPYSLDLALSDFFIFKDENGAWKQRFQDVNVIKHNTSE